MNIDLVKAAKVNNEIVDNLIKEARKKVESNDLIERLVEQLDRLRGQPLYSQRALIVRQADEIEQLKEKLQDYEDRITELTNAVDFFTGDTRQGIYTAIGIMTQDKEGDSD